MKAEPVNTNGQCGIRCRRVFNAIALTLLLVCGCESPTSESEGKIVLSKSEPTAQERTPGTWQEVLPAAGLNGSDIAYTILVPEGYDGETPTPLIFTLHFGGRVTPYFGRGILDILTQPALGELGAIIVAPDSAKAGWGSPENEHSILALYKAVKEAYSIDARKTLVTGYSLGGHGAFHVAATHPELFRATVPIAGTPSKEAREADWKMPLYVIHSNRDTVVDIKLTRKFVEDQTAKGADIHFAELTDLSHYETPAYVPHLKAAVPWIRKAWARE